MNWEEDYKNFQDKIREGQEQARRIRENAEQARKQRKQAEIDPMAELAKYATSTYAVFEHVYFDNGWGCYIARNGGEQRFRFTQILPGRKDGMHYTQLTPVQVVREMYKVSQYA